MMKYFTQLLIPRQGFVYAWIFLVFISACGSEQAKVPSDQEIMNIVNNHFADGPLRIIDLSDETHPNQSGRRLKAYEETGEWQAYCDIEVQFDSATYVFGQSIEKYKLENRLPAIQETTHNSGAWLSIFFLTRNPDHQQIPWLFTDHVKKFTMRFDHASVKLKTYPDGHLEFDELVLKSSLNIDDYLKDFENRN